MFFASDNAGPAAPEVLQALARANEGYAPSYGADEIMGRVTARIREIFEAPEAAVYLVATGTAANALSIATLAQPWQAVFVHRTAHVEEDECGAPEFYSGGAKLWGVDGADGKIDADALRAALQAAGERGVHSIQRGPVSITQATELGTTYTLEEIRRLTGIARDFGQPVHMDGARFANALVSLGCTPAEMTWKAGIDVLSFGGTKNGLMGVEAVILFDPARAWEFELRRKRGGHLFSKHRYLSAQMEAYLTDDLWLRLARLANDACARLARAVAGVPGAGLMFPADANMVFARWPRAGHARAFEAGASYYLWPFDQPLDGPGEEPLAARLVCNWATTQDDIDALIALIGG